MKLSLEKQIEKLIELRTKFGYSTGSLVSYAKEEFQVGTTRAYELIKEAKIMVGEFQYKTNENVLEDAIEFLESMRERAVRNDNDKLALEVQKELDKIQQLYLQRIELDGKMNIDVTKLFGFEDNDNDDDIND